MESGRTPLANRVGERLLWSQQELRKGRGKATKLFDWLKLKLPYLGKNSWLLVIGCF